MTRTTEPMRVVARGRTIVGRVFLWAWLVVGLIPLVFMLVTSIKPTGIVNQIPPTWWFPPTFSNYALIFRAGSGLSEGFGQLLLSSAVVSVGATTLALLVSVPAAYALAMRQFRARARLSNWILSTYMFPPIVAAVPIFVFAGKLGLIDTYPVLIVPYAAFNLPIVIWILRSAILQLPFELQEAAMVDGATAGLILRKIIWPLLIPAAATAAALTIVLTWNEFLFALTLTRNVAKTSAVGIQQFTGMYGTDWGAITAAGTVTVAPILVLMFVLRRQMVSGLAFGAVK